tara:strand:- start:1329 stop:2276 length:948 start_codon:yes stop_codon:yes gene_type:complete
MIDLNLYRKLKNNKPDNLNEKYFTEKIDFSYLKYFGIDQDDNPTYFFKLEKEIVNQFPTSLQNIQFIKNNEYILQNKNKEIKETFSIIKCVSESSSLIGLFLETLFSRIEEWEKNKQFNINEDIENLQKLFEKLHLPSIKSVKGLWGELFTIKNSKNINQLIEYWHTKKTQLFDFYAPPNIVEVKTTTEQKRIHYFKLEQCIFEKNMNGYLHSVMTIEKYDGLSCYDLYKSINQKVSNRQIKEKLEKVYFETVGSNFEKFDEDKFCLKTAEENSLFFDLNLIPTPSKQIPKEVDQVKFRVDLSYTPQCEFDLENI